MASAAGEALTILPPMVACARIWSSANHTAQRGIAGSARASAASSRKRWIGVAAPSRTRRVVDAALVQFRNFRDVDQHRDFDIAGAALARPGQRVGAAGDDAVTAAMLRHRGEGLVERAGVRYSSQMSIAALFSLPFGEGRRAHQPEGLSRLIGARRAPLPHGGGKSYSAATLCAAPMFAFTTTLIASSTRSLA